VPPSEQVWSAKHR